MSVVIVVGVHLRSVLVTGLERAGEVDAEFLVTLCERLLVPLLDVTADHHTLGLLDDERHRRAIVQSEFLVRGQLQEIVLQLNLCPVAASQAMLPGKVSCPASCRQSAAVLSFREIEEDRPAPRVRTTPPRSSRFPSSIFSPRRRP